MNTAAPTPTIADVFRSGFSGYCSQFGVPHHDALNAARAIMACRTERLGGQRYRCDHCGEELLRYHSCRNRSCPTCQTTKRLEWVHARIDELLPVGYFHVVFTLPQELAPFALRNQKVFYDLMFRCVNQTLQQLAADPKRMGAHIGFIAILHTWGQNLMHHPHVHCVVPGGGLDPATMRWKPSGERFLFPVSVMRKLFRGKLMDCFVKAVATGEIKLHGSLAEYADSRRFKRLLDQLYAKTWVVYCKAPFASPQAVVKYLGQYTHPSTCSGTTPRHARGPSRRHLQQPTHLHQRRFRHLRLQGLRRSPPSQVHVPRTGRVHPPLPHARGPIGLRAHPPLRLHGQP